MDAWYSLPFMSAAWTWIGSPLLTTTRRIYTPTCFRTSPGVPPAATALQQEWGSLQPKPWKSLHLTNSPPSLPVHISSHLTIPRQHCSRPCYPPRLQTIQDTSRYPKFSKDCCLPGIRSPATRTFGCLQQSLHSSLKGNSSNDSNSSSKNTKNCSGIWTRGMMGIWLPILGDRVWQSTRLYHIKILTHITTTPAPSIFYKSEHKNVSHRFPHPAWPMVMLTSRYLCLQRAWKRSAHVRGPRMAFQTGRVQMHWPKVAMTAHYSWVLADLGTLNLY